MPNKALNQVSQVQSTELANVKTFLAVMNNGEIKQMSKEDMASVVGGLLSISKYIKLTTKALYINSGDSIELTDINGFVMIKSIYDFGGYKFYWVSGGKYQDLAPNIPGYGLYLELSFVEGVFKIKNTASAQRRIDIAYQTLPEGF